jgi:gamma-glutamyltranspeptidase/glutathione hydrolase
VIAVKERSEAQTCGAARGWRQHPAVRVEGAAATAFPLATEVALETLQAGGNAVDAAVASAWALCVCEPSGSGLGGQTTLLLYQANGTARIIDGHSYAPKSVSLDAVTPSEQRNGYRSCTIPSTPATLDYASRKYGVLPRSQLLSSAIRIAEDGYALTRLQHRQTRRVAPLLRMSAETSELFLRDGHPMPAGEIFRQPVLAKTLRRLADEGIEDFYHGNVARQIVDDMQRHDGLISAEDLADCDCALPVEREALRAEYRGYEVMSGPPPGGGLQVLFALRVLEELAPHGFAGDADEWREAMALAIYSAFLERETSLLLKPADITASHIDRALDRDRIRRLAAGLRRQLASLDDARSGVEEPGDTTHLTVADRHGDVVALTQSVQSLFGAKVANASSGFLYNNYLRTCPREAHPYQLGSFCQPRSNCAPTLVLKNGAAGRIPFMALGAAGSRRIVSGIVQVISGVIDRGLGMGEAVAAPRVHALLNRHVWIEEPAAGEHLLKELQQRSLQPRTKRALSYDLGSVQALQWLPDGTISAAADPRRDGTASVLVRGGNPPRQ